MTDRFLKLRYESAHAQSLVFAEDAVIAAVYRSVIQFTQDHTLQDSAEINPNTIPEENGYLVLPEGTPRSDSINARRSFVDLLQSYLQTAQHFSSDPGTVTFTEFINRHQSAQDPPQATKESPLQVTQAQKKEPVEHQQTAQQEEPHTQLYTDAVPKTSRSYPITPNDFMKLCLAAKLGSPYNFESFQGESGRLWDISTRFNLDAEEISKIILYCRNNGIKIEAFNYEEYQRKKESGEIPS